MSEQWCCTRGVIDKSLISAHVGMLNVDGEGYAGPVMMDDKPTSNDGWQAYKFRVI